MDEQEYQRRRTEEERLNATHRTHPRVNHQGNDPTDVSRLNIGRRDVAEDDEMGQTLKWIKDHAGKRALVTMEGKAEEWMIVGPQMRYNGKETVYMVVINKKVDGKVSSFEKSVEELKAMGISWT